MKPSIGDIILVLLKSNFSLSKVSLLCVMIVLTSSISAWIIFSCAFLESIIAFKDKISDSNDDNWKIALSYSSKESSYSFSEINFLLNSVNWLS